MGISYSYDSLPSAITLANGSRSIQWLTADEEKCCENDVTEYLRVCVCGGGAFVFISVHVLHMFLCQGLACVPVWCGCPVRRRGSAVGGNEECVGVCGRGQAIYHVVEPVRLKEW